MVVVGGILDSPTWQNADPRLRAQLSAFMQASGGRVSLGNAWRSHEQQADLYRRKPNLAARPGSSNHEFGLAADLVFADDAARRWAHQNAHRFGLWFPMDYEPWHVQLIGVDRHNIGGGRRVGGGRNAFPPGPDMRFINPYDRLAQLVADEDPFDPMEQFGRLVQMMSAGDTSGVLASPDASMLSAPAAPGVSAEPEALASTVTGAAPGAAAMKEPDGS